MSIGAVVKGIKSACGTGNRVDGRAILCFVTLKDTFAIHTAADGDVLTIRAETDVHDSALDFRKCSDEIEIVSDLSRLLSDHFVDLRDAVGTTRQQLVLFGVTVNRVESALQRAGSDAGDVVNETLCRHVHEFHGAVTTDRDQVIVIHRKDRVEHPVIMRAIEKFLLARQRIDRANRIVGASKRQQLFVA